MSSPYSPYPQGDNPAGYGQRPEGGGQPVDYLHGAPVDFGQAIAGAFKNIFTFNGRASRSAFWWFILVGFIIDVVIGVIARAAKVTVLEYIVVVVIAIVTIGLQLRRLHDSGRSGWWWWIGFIPIIGAIVLIVSDCPPS